MSLLHASLFDPGGPLPQPPGPPGVSWAEMLGLFTSGLAGAWALVNEGFRRRRAARDDARERERENRELREENDRLWRENRDLRRRDVWRDDGEAIGAASAASDGAGSSPEDAGPA